MKRRPHLTVGITIAFLLSSCASATVSFDSSPQKADIYVLSGFDQGDGKKIGTTPLMISGSDIARATGSGGPVYVEMRKDHHRPARAVITDAAAADVRLSLALEPSSGLEDQETTNSAVDLLFESQRLTLSGRYDEAIAKIKQVQKDLPQLAAAYEIEGGAYVMQKRLPEALDAYRIAARINPRNPETLRMRNYLERMLGTEAPSPRASVAEGKETTP